MLLAAIPNASHAEPTVSPLMICDQLLTLAKDVDRAGLRGTAEQLLALVSEVLEPQRVRRSV